MSESYLERAELVARRAHAGQADTVTGAEYIGHVERVVSMVEGDEAKAVAWLHDVVEDSEVTLSDLLALGIPDQVVRAVDLLTRRKPYEYQSYIQAIVDSGDRLAVPVKMADLVDHLHPNCPVRLRPRYERAVETFKAAYAGRT